MAGTRRGRAVSGLPPGPGPAGALRFLQAAAGGGILDFFAATVARYGPVASFVLGTQRIVIVDEPSIIEEILVTRQHEFVRDTGAALLRELVGEGLLTTEDPLHLQRRRLMQPAFHRARVAAYTDSIVAEIDRIVDVWQAGQTLDAGKEMAALTLAAVGAALFGENLSGEAAAVADVLARVVRRGSAFAMLLAVTAPFLGRLQRRSPARPSLLFPRERAELQRIVTPLVARERTRTGGADLLSMLLAARDDGGAGLDDAAVRNEICMLVLAGHETTANALTWTWYLLARHAAVEARLHAEVDAVLAGRRPRFEDVAQLSYVARVFDEALRLYPPASAFARRPLAATRLGAYAIPRLASVFVSPYLTQRNPRFYDDPLAFCPERWERASLPKFAYFPFGGGSKMCIGEPLARMEAVLAIARIASRYTLRLTDPSPIAATAQALLKPRRPVLVTITPRRNGAPARN